MNFIMQRAMYCGFAAQEISGGDGAEIWRAVAALFGVSPEEKCLGERLVSGSALAGLKTAEDARLLQKWSGFGGFRLSADEEEVLELKYQALLKVEQLAAEYRATPLKAVASAHGRDPVAAVFYAVQILLHNKGRSELGYEILSAALSAEQSCDAGLLLLNAKHKDKNGVWAKLAETPEMILHPEVLQALAEKHGLDPDAAGRGGRIGF